ncbi:MAG: nitrate- and nitrite sensing domain-containing protein [Actinomycetota bacterium]|nr:nitrate- and nitrite sensing domain-containing protein [Actinomycetota bacterium]
MLLVIPLILAGVLGGIRIASSVNDIQGFSAAQRQVTLSQSVASVIDSLQTERHLAAAFAATQAVEQQALVEAQIQQVDANIAALRDLESNPGVLPSTSADAYRDVLSSLDTLGAVRARALAPGTAVELSVGRYSEVISTLLRFNRIALPGTEAGEENVATGVAYIAEAKEQVSLQHAVLLAASLGDIMTSVERTELRTTEAAFDSAIRNFAESVPSAERQIYFSTYRGADISNRERLLLIGLGEWPTFVALNSIAAEWDATATSVGNMLLTVESALHEHLAEDTATASDAAVANAIRDASIIALLLLFTLILLVLVARSVLRPLLALRTSALDVAQRRLPALVEQLRRPGGWKDSPAPEPVAVHTGEDIGQVARAFDEVHKEAVRLATEQAMMRSTVNDMFANLSRRSQSMVERQLRIIDTLESGERDPEALGELFRLDHLATRMRRNNENLLVLAGSETRQRAGADRPALDVLRGALSEIEEYQRITIEAVPDAKVRGVAVNDLVHLTAELLDNATNFSPKQAQVVLASSLQADGGLLIEIRDFGVGMSATQRNAINDRLAVPPMVDVSVSRHMGLFVVGRLAARHGISVRMQVTGPEGGLTAAVSVPSALIATEAQLATAPVRIPEASGNGSPSPAETGSLWDAARSAPSPPAGAAPIPAGTGAMSDESRNGTAIPAAAAAPLSAPAQESGSLFAATAASTLDPDGFRLTQSDPALGLFAPSVPAGQLTDFFATPQDEPLSSQPLEATPIFQEMRSAWFRQRPDLAPETTGTADDGDVEAAPAEPVAAPEDFGSAADEGWQAAEQLLTPVDAGTTRAGLPRRRPRAHLVPGASRPAAETGTLISRPNNVTPLRDAERVRGNLSSYQRGTRRGRHSTPMEDSERSIGDPTRNGVGRHGELPTSQERQ